MSSGTKNQLTKQIGECLVCAELARRGFYATPFAGNVPTFDVLAANEAGRVIRIQVKATRSDNWPSDAREWMDIELEGSKQVVRQLRKLPNPDLIYVCVAIASDSDQRQGRRDRFFILRASDLQQLCHQGYSRWMEERGWVRPKNPKSFDNRYGVTDIAQFENNWDLLTEPSV
jgi:hypothetical protein